MIRVPLTWVALSLLLFAFACSSHEVKLEHDPSQNPEIRNRVDEMMKPQPGSVPAPVPGKG